MQVRRVSDVAELRKLASSWNCLTRGIPFRSWQWLLSWWDHYQSGNELYVLTVHHHDDVVGIAPWFVTNRGTRGRVVQFLGSGDVCSDYLDLLLCVEHRDAVVAAIADWLLEAAHSTDNRWDLLELDGIDMPDPAISKLAAALQSHGCFVRSRTAGNFWRIELPDDWESYLSSLSKSHRKQVRRAQRRLENGEAVLASAKDPQEINQGMQWLADLHTRRWQSLGQPGCFASDRFSGFLHAAANQLFEAGMLQLRWLMIDNQPAAAEFQIISGNIVYSYQSGVDPEAMALEPGRLLNIATIQEAIESGCAAIDFLRGDEPYKAHWRAQPRPYQSWQIAATRTSSKIRHVALVAGDTMRDLVKGGLQLTGIR